MLETELQAETEDDLGVPQKGSSFDCSLQGNRQKLKCNN